MVLTVVLFMTLLAMGAPRVPSARNVHRMYPMKLAASFPFACTANHRGRRASVESFAPKIHVAERHGEAKGIASLDRLG
jgi:hypothetical protein